MLSPAAYAEGLDVEAGYARADGGRGVELGAGVRVSEDAVRPYATLAMPIFPKLRVRANVGPAYYAPGLTLGY